MDLPFEYEIHSGRAKHRGLLEAFYFYLHLAEEDIKGLLGMSDLPRLPSDYAACVCAGQAAACVAASRLKEMFHHIRYPTDGSVSNLRSGRLHEAMTWLADLADVARAKKDVLRPHRDTITGKFGIDTHRLRCFHGMRARLRKLNHFREDKSTKARVVSTFILAFLHFSYANIAKHLQISISACKDDRFAEVGVIDKMLSGDFNLKPLFRDSPEGERKAGVLTSGFLSVLGVPTPFPTSTQG